MDNLSVVIPETAENLKLPDPDLITYYKNLDNRILWIDSEIDSQTLEFAKNILDWNREDKGKTQEERKPIKLLFYSYGGDLDVNQSIIDVIKLSQTPVYGYNMGVACSAGCYIYLACHKKFMMPNAYFLMHQGSANNISGTFAEVLSYVQDYTAKMDALMEYVKEHTNIPDDIFKENIMKEWYIYSDEAVEYGLCDKIITSLDEII